MKKAILCLAVALISATALQAQLLVGGSLGIGGEFGTKKVVNNQLISIGNSSFNFTFVPRIGIRLISDKLEIGAALRLQYKETTSYVIKSDNKSAEKDLLHPDFVIYVNPYARYLFLNKGWFNLGIEGVVDLGWGIALADKQFATGFITPAAAEAYNQAQKDLIKNTRHSDFRWGVNIRPVMVFDLTDHWMMDMTLDGLGFSVSGVIKSLTADNTQTNTSRTAIQLNAMSADHQFFTLGCTYKF
jgi:hypothetical protein